MDHAHVPNETSPHETSSRETSPALRAIRIAVLAMGGEGGGVLANWLIALARNNGYVGQMTSVPGVAQRTGATLYYIEIFPMTGIKPGQRPVLALMPVPGDVDIVLASELMEAGRAIQRGIVTPDKTCLIASSHRVYSMTERLASADGRVDAQALLSACRTAARRFLSFDMMRMAEQSGSVISAVMFGALAGAHVLPFDRQAFEATITESGIGGAASLKAFAAGYEAGSGKLITPADPAPAPVTAPVTVQTAALQHKVKTLFPEAAHAVICEGVAQCADWQDQAYADLYLQRLTPFAALESGRSDQDARLCQEVGRQLALAMCYEDTIRVADLKIRASRFDRVAQEVGVKTNQILEVREYLHPRRQEILESLPAGLGALIARLPLMVGLIDHVTREGRTVETTSVRGFMMLYGVAWLRIWRRSTPRYAQEQQAITVWLEQIAQVAPSHYDCAVEMAELRAVIKGYGDTHARTKLLFDRIWAVLPQLKGAAAVSQLQALRKAAQSDETGEALTRSLANLA